MSNAMQTHGAPSWLAHNCTDPKAARNFYEKVLGWAIVDMPMNDGTIYPAITVSEQPIGGFSPTPTPDGMWLAFVTVDDVDARYERALSEGAVGLSEPTDMPGIGRMARIRDPFGAALALITYTDRSGS